MKRKKQLNHLPFIILIVAISLYSVRGYLLNMSSTLPTTGSDDSIITWILNQTIMKIPNDLGNIFNGNIFFPYKNTMAYSIMMIPSAVISYIPTVISGSYLTAFNFTVVFSQITTAIILYLILYEVTESKEASTIGSIVLILSKIRMFAGVHIHVFVMQYFLLGAYFLIKLKKTDKLAYLYFTFLMMGIQVWESLLQVIFLLIVMATLLFYDFGLLKKRLKHFITASFLAITIALPPAISYIKVALEFGRPRDIREVAHFSASIDQILIHYWSTGLYMLFLVSIFLVLFAKLRKNKYLIVFLIITLIGFLFSLGPVLKLGGSTLKLVNIPIPLPYIIVYQLFPPIWAIRSVHRFVWLMAFGMTGVISIVLSAYNKKFLKIFFIPLLLITILGGITTTRHYKFPDSNEYKGVYKFIKYSEIDSICEYPFFGVNNNHGEEMKRMVYSLYHEKGLYNGASGFLSRDRAKDINLVKKAFPEKEFIEILREDSIDYFVLHKEFIDFNIASELRERYLDLIVFEDKQSLVFDLRKYGI